MDGWSGLHLAVPNCLGFQLHIQVQRRRRGIPSMFWNRAFSIELEMTPHLAALILFWCRFQVNDAPGTYLYHGHAGALIHALFFSPFQSLLVQVQCIGVIAQCKSSETKQMQRCLRTKIPGSSESNGFVEVPKRSFFQY